MHFVCLLFTSAQIEERSEISFPLLSDLPKMRWGELSQVCQTHGFSSEPGFHDVKDESSLRKFVEECIMKRQVSSCCPLDKVRKCEFQDSHSEKSCLQRLPPKLKLVFFILGRNEATSLLL